jgi:hypothetical protein
VFDDVLETMADEPREIARIVKKAPARRVANAAHQEIERRMGSLYRMWGSGRRIA